MTARSARLFRAPRPPPHTPAPPPSPSLSLCPAHLSPVAARAWPPGGVCFPFPSERRAALRPPPQPTRAGRRGSPATTAQRAGCPAGTDPLTPDRHGGTRRGGASAGDASPAATPASTRQHLATLGHAHPGRLQACGLGMGVDICTFPEVAGLLLGSFPVVSSLFLPSVSSGLFFTTPSPSHLCKQRRERNRNVS
ncbi:nascent polypeptide-associated complex subunit alpha, muscle-specific form-like [Alexandromys fortis]|uniref:nascent polypeptide-associated complex subunit alpha, muscle-specific form-like n=1 Tax=Alexandromys fortis TaxID=100897 RepID=UPI00215385AF|nr:nascent polypeptide-associated complex subunit alpha, muscle-specific form-like [Microtus fortis]